MSKFKAGDAVRVKAGSPSVLWRLGRKEIPKEQMHIVEGYFSDKYGERVHLVGGDYVAEVQYLEPWNDSEEWDGEKWVADAEKVAARQAEAAKVLAVAEAKTAISTMDAAVEKATDLEGLKKIVLDLIKNVHVLTA